MKLTNRQIDVLLMIALAVVVVGASFYRWSQLRSARHSVEAPRNYMDRYTLTDTLISIFGTEARTIVIENLFDLGAPMGGSCDFYKMTYDAQQKVIDPLARCPAGPRDLNTPMFVKPNPIRNASIRKSCRLLTENPETLTHALQSVKISPESAVTPSSFADIYFAFYKTPLDGSPRKEWTTALEKTKDWPSAVYQLCVSQEWQIL